MTFEKPKQILTYTEPFRLLLDVGKLLRNYSFFKKNKTEHNIKNPILFLPGYLCSDASTMTFRYILGNYGFNSYGWDNGTNLGVREDAIKAQIELIKRMYNKHNEKVILIGYSLGGVYAKELSHICSEYVEQVITIGSPINDYSGDSSSITKLYKYFNKTMDSDALEHYEKTFFNNLRNFNGKSITSIFSKDDGIVHWKASKLEKNENTKNIEVSGSHFGLIYNPDVISSVISEILIHKNIQENL